MNFFDNYIDDRSQNCAIKICSDIVINKLVV